MKQGYVWEKLTPRNKRRTDYVRTSLRDFDSPNFKGYFGSGRFDGIPNLTYREAISLIKENKMPTYEPSFEVWAENEKRG